MLFERRGHWLGVFGCLLVLMGTASADQEAESVAAMKRFAAAWQVAIDNRQPLLTTCANDTLQAMRFKAGSVRFDVKRTDSVINPLVGIVYVQGSFESNGFSPRANGFRSETMTHGKRIACFKTGEMALSATGTGDYSPAFNGRHRDFVVYYTGDGDQMRVVGGNDEFQTNFLYHINTGDNALRWAGVLSQPLQ